MTEEVITELGKISALKSVISRTSIMQYKGTRKRVPEIAQELNVDAVVEGSIVSAGDRVRITVKLYGAKDEQLLWTESYQRDVHDILALQSDLGRAIASEIRVKLTLRIIREYTLASALLIHTRGCLSKASLNFKR